MITGSSGGTPTTRDVGRFLRLFTDLPLDEIARLEALEGAEINEAKMVLATEATALCRGAEAADAAAETARRTFEEGGAGDESADMAKVSGSNRDRRRADRARLRRVEGEARRLIAEGAARSRRWWSTIRLIVLVGDR